MKTSQIFVGSSLLGAVGALLALVQVAWVFALGLAIIVFLLSRALGANLKGASFLTGSLLLAFFLAQDRLFKLVPSRDDLSQLRADYVSFKGTILNSKFKDTDAGRFYTVEVACRSLVRPWAKPLTGKVLVQAGPYKDQSVPLWGSSYLFSGRVEHPHAKLFSFEFDQKRWLLLKDIYCQVSCQPDNITLVKSSLGADRVDCSALVAVMQLVATTRDAVVSGHCQAIGDIRGRVLASMVLGDRAVCLSDSLRAAFNRVGLSHLLAASGLNLTIIVGAALFIFSIRKKKSRDNGLLQTIGALICVLFFVSLAGSSPSVTRATIMCLLLLWSSLLFRRLATGAALAFALWLALLLDPLSILDVGLELSYGATFGIIYFVPIFSAAAPPPVNKKPWAWLVSLTNVVLAAQLAVLPVQVFYFQKLSTLVLPANILAEPLVAPITVAGFISSMGFALAAVCKQLALTIPQLMIERVSLCIDYGCGFLVDLLLSLTHYLGSLPIAYLYLAQPAGWTIVLYYLILFIAFLLASSQPRCGAFMALVAGFVFTAGAFLESAFVEIFLLNDKIIVVSPWSAPELFTLTAPLCIDTLARSSGASSSSGYLPAYRRDFLQAYLRALSSRGLASPLPKALKGSTLFSIKCIDKQSTLSLVNLTDFAFCTPLPAAAVAVERVQSARLIKLKTWGVFAVLLNRCVRCKNLPDNQKIEL